MNSTNNSATYVYAVSRPHATWSASALVGVADRPVRSVRSDDLMAMVSTVDLAEFGEEALRSNLEDLTWVEQAARAHHHVVEELSRAAPVVPFRLATVYLNDGRVVAELDRRHAELAACLDRLEGRTEWSVKALWDQPADQVDPQADDQLERPGTAFLLRRRSARSRHQHDREAAEQQAKALHDALAGLSVASRRYPPQPAQLTGDVREMLLNASYLIDGTEPNSLAAVLDEHGGSTLHCELGGPWAPYSFASLEEEDR